MTSDFEQLRARRDQLAQRLATEKAVYTASKEATSTEIAALRSAADGLAAEFRSLFTAASSAYAGDDRADAARLSAQGRAAQAKCQALNAQAKSKSEVLGEQKTRIDNLSTELADVRAQLKALRSSAKRSGTWVDPTRHIQVSGFEYATSVDEALVRSTLGILPPRLLNEIGKVVYIDMYVGKMGDTDAKPNRGKMATMRLYQGRDGLNIDHRTAYKMTVLHEAGHVLFERFATLSQRLQWGKLFNDDLLNGRDLISPHAKLGLREDAAECFLFYMAAPSKLYEKSPERYTFIDKLYQEVSK